jgi:hypothetical protein
MGRILGFSGRAVINSTYFLLYLQEFFFRFVLQIGKWDFLNGAQKANSRDK